MTGEISAAQLVYAIRLAEPGLHYIKSVNLARTRHHLAAETIIRITRLAGAKVGLSNVTPKVLRANFATHMLSRGSDLYTVQRLLGHKHLSATTAYLRLPQRNIARAYRNCHLPAQINLVNGRCRE